MTRSVSALTVSFSLLALAGVGLVLMGDRSARVAGVSHAELEQLRGRLDRFENRLRELASDGLRHAAPETRRSTTLSQRPADGDEDYSIEEAGEGEGEDDGLASPESALLARLESLETRLRGLEEDPVQRAYTYLQSENAELRKRGVYSLETLAKSDPEARATLREMLADPDAGVRSAALDTLADIQDKEVVPLAASLLEDNDVAVRREAINALTRLRAKDAAADIASFIADEDDKVRWLAVDSVGKLGHRASAGALLSALGDSNTDIRGEAISSLGEIGATEAIPRLRELYKVQAEQTERHNGDHRVRLAQALKQLGDRSAVQSEISRLGDQVLKGGNERSRGGAMKALLWIGRGEPAAKEYFRQLTGDRSGWIRREAARALESGRDDANKG